MRSALTRSAAVLGRVSRPATVGALARLSGASPARVRVCDRTWSAAPARLSTTATAPAAAAQSGPQPVPHAAFRVLSHRHVAELSATATLYEHVHTGAQVLSVVAPDEEKVFGIAFRTPSQNDTGVAHIMEHSVLCGSRKFPVKEPFVALLRASTHTYLNAMTYSDRTVYPVASPNTKDFYNLVEVYLDAVFFPRLQPWVLQQEGWHYEVSKAQHTAQADAADAKAVEAAAAAASPSSRKLTYKGVVFNEMKGVFSSPDNVRGYAEERELFRIEAGQLDSSAGSAVNVGADGGAVHPYFRISGGDPLAIPFLKFNDFLRFHAQHYTPSNARAFFFGDDDVTKRLDKLNEYFTARADRLGVQPASVTYLPLAKAPRRVYVGVPAEAAEDGEGGDGVGTHEDAGEGGDEVVADVVHAGGASSADSAGPSHAAVASREASADAHGALAADAVRKPRPEDDHEVFVDYSVGAAGSISVRRAASPSLPQFLGTVPAETASEIPVASRSGPLASKHALSVNWLLNDAPLDDITRLGLALLTHLLMSTQVATLYKALTDSALGASVIGGGVDTSLLQSTFSVGLKGVHVDNVDKVEAVIMETLREAARTGFTKEHLESSLNSIEFGLREFAGGGGPRGLALFLSAVPAWMYGRDPISELEFEVPLQQLKQRVASDPTFLQDLIRKYLLDNKHRVTVHAYPDPSYNARREAVERAALDQVGAGMTDEQWEEVEKNAEELKRRQATPDPPEAMATIPTLQLSDLPRDSKPIPKAVKYLAADGSSAQVASAHATDTKPFHSSTFRGLLTAAENVRQALPAEYRHGASTARERIVEKHTALHHTSGAAEHGTEFLQHVLPANGITYVSAYFDLSPLPQRLLPYLPLFAWATTSCGTATTDEVRMSHLLGTHTGGVGVASSVSDVPGSRGHALPYLVLGAKALNPSVDRMGELATELLLTARLDRKDRIAHYLRSSIARHESGVVGSGHKYASSVLSGMYTKAGWISERLGGLSQLYMARELLHRIETGEKGGFDGIVADLHEIRQHLLRRNNVLFSATADEKGMINADTMFQRLLQALPSSGPATGPQQAHTHAHTLPRLASAWSWLAGDEPHERSLAPSPVPGRLHADATVPRYVGIVVPTQVNYVCKSACVYADGHTAHGSTEVITNLLRTGYLWEKVRVQGGAYGGFCSVSRHSGVVSFGSYRDPALAHTLTTFDGTGDHLRAACERPDALAEELRKAIISTVGGLDAPLSPEERGERSTARHVCGITHTHVQKRRQEIMDTGVADVRAFAHALDGVAREGHVCVVASEEAFAQYAAERKGPEFHLLHPFQDGMK